MKECNKCKRELPSDTHHFFKNCGTKDGLTGICKECRGKSFTSKLSIKIKDGYKICKKCNRELLIDIRFFPEDKLCTDGFRNICRECGKDGHFMKEGYVPKRKWSKDEDDFFIQIYKHYTNEELVNLHYPNTTAKELSNRAYRLDISGKTDDCKKRIREKLSKIMSGKNSPFRRKWTDQHRINFSIALKGKYVGVKNKLYGIKKSDEHKAKLSETRKKMKVWTGANNPRHKNPLIGEANGRWKGGVTPVNKKIRSSNEYLKWRESVFKRDNYTCQCCGDNTGHNLQAHHIENFSSNEDLRFEIKNGLTMCNLCHDFRFKDSFHNIYGTHNNTKEQLDKYILIHKNNKQSKEVS